MALRHLRFFPHTLPLTLTPTPNPNNSNRFSFFTPSLSSTTLMATAHKVLVPIADGTEPMEAVITIDVLRRSGADVTVASASDNLAVQALHGVKIIADAPVRDVAATSFDLVALPVPLSLNISYMLVALLLKLFRLLIIKLKMIPIN